MADGKGKKKYQIRALSPALIQKFQRRFAHFVNDYKHRNGLQAKELASKLGYSYVRFAAIASENGYNSRVINALDILAVFGALENMSVSDFVCYLDGKTDRFKEDEPGRLNRSLFMWERVVLEAFDPISTIIRRDFVDFCKESTTQGKEKLELLLEFVNYLKTKDVKVIKGLLENIKLLTPNP